ITPEIEAIVLHAIEKDRNRRFQSMAEMAAAVENPTDHIGHYSQLPGYAGGAPSAGASSHGTMMMPSDQPTIRGPSGVMPTIKGPMTGSGPRPTTLSGAASEVGDMPARKSKAPLI